MNGASGLPPAPVAISSGADAAGSGCARPMPSPGSRGLCRNASLGTGLQVAGALQHRPAHHRGL
ncbi:MAG: hypothetical protein MZW92_26870 [Comamonadaceae bacterium]|nr:hypothetical protein [Comamonadaceae bacterium]